MPSVGIGGEAEPHATSLPPGQQVRPITVAWWLPTALVALVVAARLLVDSPGTSHLGWDGVFLGLVAAVVVGVPASMLLPRKDRLPPPLVVFGRRSSSS